MLKTCPFRNRPRIHITVSRHYRDTRHTSNKVCVLNQVIHPCVCHTSMLLLQVIKAIRDSMYDTKEPYKRDDILQKRLVILSSLLIEATPYTLHFMCVSYIHATVSSHKNDTRHTSNEVYMGWLRLVGSLKLQVSFAEYRLFYRALLQKRPIILKSLLLVATPYLYTSHMHSCVCRTTMCAAYIHVCV